METRANYILVGAFALVVLLGFAVAAVWLARVELRENTVQYDVFFEGSVTGLRPGNAVRYRGVPVGTVAAMRINPQNVEQVQVTLGVPAGTPIKVDTVASLELEGITGVAYVQLSGGTQEAPPLTAQPGQERPVIESKPSQLQELFATAPELLSRFLAVTERLNLLLSPGNIENFSAVLENMEVLTRSFADNAAGLDDLAKNGSVALQDISRAAATAETTLADLHALASEMQKQLTGIKAEETMETVRRAAKQFGDASEQLATLLDETKGPLDTFTKSGLYELTQLLAEARVLVSELARIAAEVERNPTRFLFGSPQPGVEVK